MATDKNDDGICDLCIHTHTYTTTKTSPTCTEKGYTTYTCDCGDSYVDNYVDAKKHNYTSTIARPATHLSEGVRTYTCSGCGDSYPESIAKIEKHSYAVLEVVAPKCENEGYTVYACECGDSYKGDYISATGHNYNGPTCVDCSKKCSCNCHAGGIKAFFFKLVNFFAKLFNPAKRVCVCGVKH